MNFGNGRLYVVSRKTRKVAKVGTVPAVSDMFNTMYKPKVKTKTKVGLTLHNIGLFGLI